MQEQEFIVTDPPHGAVDHTTVAGLLGLDLDTTRPKVAFGAPEVLSASDPTTNRRLHQELRAAGLTAEIVMGQDLARIPWPRIVRAFTLEDEGLRVHLAGESIERLIPWSERVFAVSCRPPENFPAGGPGGDPLTGGQTMLLLESGDGPLQAEAIQWGSILDLFFDRASGLERVTFARDITDFSGLPDVAGATGEECMVECLTQCALRFGRFSLDRRLEGVRPRRRFTMGADNFDLDQRKLFSYGTLLLRQALNNVDSTLGDLTQYELGARLAWVLRGRERG